MHPMLRTPWQATRSLKLCNLFRIQQTSAIHVGEERKMVEFQAQKRPLNVYVRDPCHVFGQKYPELT